MTHGWDQVNTEAEPNNRLVFDWNNITEWEAEQVERLKEQLEVLGVEIPAYHSDADLLKYA